MPPHPAPPSGQLPDRRRRARAAAATAAAAPVEGGSLAWHTVNDFGPSATPTLNRTWFGYVTNPNPAGGANGTVTPVAPAFGPALTGASPRGEAAACAGACPPSPAATTTRRRGPGRSSSTASCGTARPCTGFAYSLVDPQVVLDGANSKLYRERCRSWRRATSGHVRPLEPVFDLDLAGRRSPRRRSSASRRSIATADWGFPDNYPSGRDRTATPNTFGSFTVTFGATLSATTDDRARPGRGDRRGDR